MRTITMIIKGWILKKSIPIGELNDNVDINKSTLSPKKVSKFCPIKSNKERSMPSAKKKKSKHYQLGG